MCHIINHSNSVILIALISNIVTVYGDKVNITKCCANNEVVFVKEWINHCLEYDGLLNFSNVTVYDRDKFPTKKTFTDAFNLIENKTFINSVPVYYLSIFNYYLTEDGAVYTELPNVYNRWSKYETHLYCMDYYFTNSSDIPSVRVGWFLFLESAPDPATQNPILTIPAMFVSSFFFALVLVVYALLPELRNLHGLVLMAYVVSMIGAFCTVATFQLTSIYDYHHDNVCISLTFTAYYFIISSFFWMNVMSFDIWWTFRGYAKARLIHRRGEMCKFYTYCAYAFGVPAAMTIAAIIINNSNMTYIPWFVKPNIPMSGCFLQGTEKFIYLYMPMLIILLMNWIFFLMTAFNIWRLHRGTAMLDKGGNRKHHNQRQRFYVYLKLSVIMGTSWVLEVLSTLKPDSIAWKLTDSYNLSIGVTTFIIFICKRKIFRMLKKRLMEDREDTLSSGNWYSSRRYRRTNSSGSNTTDSELHSSNDNSMQVSFNPKGNMYK